MICLASGMCTVGVCISSSIWASQAGWRSDLQLHLNCFHIWYRDHDRDTVLIDNVSACVKEILVLRSAFRDNSRDVASMYHGAHDTTFATSKQQRLEHNGLRTFPQMNSK
ncbi:hypothetical protein V6000_003910 [Aspergillus fumigatus]